MGRQIIRVARDDPRYLVWNTVIGMPVMFGDRAETLEFLLEDYRQGGERWIGERGNAERRLNLADEHGGDAHPPFLVGWGPEKGKTYLQRGVLRRKNFVAWCDRMEAALTADPDLDWAKVDVNDLLDLFDDEKD